MEKLIQLVNVEEIQFEDEYEEQEYYYKLWEEDRF